MIFIGLLFLRWVIRVHIELTSISGVVVPNERYIPILTNSVFVVLLFFFFSSFFPGWSLAWFLSFPQDTQKRYPYQGRLCLPLFCLFNVFLMSSLCVLFCCRFGIFLFILLCSVLCIVRSCRLFLSVYADPKEKKIQRRA